MAMLTFMFHTSLLGMKQKFTSFFQNFVLRILTGSRVDTGIQTLFSSTVHQSVRDVFKVPGSNLWTLQNAVPGLISLATVWQTSTFTGTRGKSFTNMDLTGKIEDSRIQKVGWGTRTGARTSTNWTQYVHFHPLYVSSVIPRRDTYDETAPQDWS